MIFFAGLRSALREFKRPGLWLGIWLFGWLLCVVLSLIPPPQVGIDLPQGDKLGHLLAYALLSVWSVWIFASRRSHWKATLSLVLLGILMELAQGALTSDRMMDGRDILADTLGVLSGQLLALTQAQSLLQQWDLRLFREL
jgi:VanZ family protein